MAAVYADECCMCPPELGCLGIFCPKRRRVHICDSCGEPVSEDTCDTGYETEVQNGSAESSSFVQRSETYGHQKGGYKAGSEFSSVGVHPENREHTVYGKYTADGEICAECAQKVHI